MVTASSLRQHISNSLEGLNFGEVPLLRGLLRAFGKEPIVALTFALLCRRTVRHVAGVRDYSNSAPHFKAVLILLAFSRLLSPRWRALVSAAGTHLLCSDMAENLTRKLRSKTSDQYFDTITHYSPLLVFTACSFVIIAAWFYYPEYLAPSYRSWITKASGMEHFILNYLRGLFHGNLTYRSVFPELLEFAKRYHLDPAAASTDLSSTQMVPPIFIHPWTGNKDLIFMRWSILNSLRMGMMMYTPLYAVASLIRCLGRPPSARGKTIAITAAGTERPRLSFQARLRQNILGILRHLWSALVRTLQSTPYILRQAARSASFLAAFVGLIFSVVLPIRHLRGADTPMGPILASMVCGLTVLIEPWSRQRQLALYVVPHALAVLGKAAADHYQMGDSNHHVISKCMRAARRCGVSLDIAVCAVMWLLYMWPKLVRIGVTQGGKAADDTAEHEAAAPWYIKSMKWMMQ